MFKVDFIGNKAIEWHRTGKGLEKKIVEDYRPRFYINASKTDLMKSRAWIAGRPEVETTSFETWRPTLSEPETRVLRIDASSEKALRKAVNDLKSNFDRSRFRFYNVDLTPQFRYCIQNQIEPRPETKLKSIDLKLERRHIASRDINELEINGEKFNCSEDQILQNLKDSLNETDILFVNRVQVLKLLREKIANSEFDFPLGRLDRFEKLAGENTVSSYGKTVHSAARYNVPGRIVIDRSNSFLLGEATMEGLWDLVSRSYKPMQELAWGSIGNVLTSIEVRKAYLEDRILTPWKNWEGEQPKKAETLHAADRGGFIFSPKPGVYENVYECDFASLFPNIMVKKNISPETVCCSCCDNDDVPELDYSICKRQRGFISEVLEPLVADRQHMKNIVDSMEGREKRTVQGSIDAIKWLLVSCFGYMGHAHASYGAIKCHQAIQAYDREIMVDAKEIFEKNNYRVLHGIIDSIWVQKDEDAGNVLDVCEEVTDEIGIELEFEHEFDWVAFVPRKSGLGGCLNRYFGKTREGYKTAGIETEQRSTCQFVKDAQMEMIRALDRDRSEVYDVLQDRIAEIRSLKVDPAELVINKKCSKPLEAYSVENRNVAAMKRMKKHGIEVHPGQNLAYVVRNDHAESLDRVRLDFEASEYDPEFYVDRLFSAAHTIMSPFGVEEKRIRQRVEGGTRMSLTEFSTGQI